VGAFQMRAASMLVFQSVLRGAVGEAFLAALAATQKYQAKASEVVGAYAKLYQLLMAAGHDSWQDYLLDQVPGTRGQGPTQGTFLGDLPAHAATGAP
jgi:hypothetical protein